MKKHLLVLATGVAALALTTAAQAQSNQAYTSQIGNGTAQNTIDITQSGSSGRVGRDGVLGSGSVLQNGGGNSLTIKQSGDGNLIGQLPNTAPNPEPQSRQVGNNNSLNIEQAGGSQNVVSFQQDGNNNNLRSASRPPADRQPTTFGAPVDYGVYPNSQWNYVGQTGGTANVTNINQNGDRNGLIILQGGGVRNAARLIQNAAVGTTTDGGINLAYFNQDGGQDNTIRLIQTNTAGPNGAFGDLNTADIRQTGNGAFNVVARYDSAGNVVGAARQVGSGLDLFVQQSGSYNQLGVSQGSAASTAINSRIEAKQDSTAGSAAQRNRITIDQSGTGQDALFQQSGASHTVTAAQAGLYNSISTQQFGSNNSVLSTQTGTGVSAAQENSLVTYQLGNDNSITNTQNGYLNVASVDQQGNSNQAFNNQSGFSNTSTILQGSTNNIANVAQAGSLNTVTVRQNR